MKYLNSFEELRISKKLLLKKIVKRSLKLQGTSANIHVEEMKYLPNYQSVKTFLSHS